MANPVSVAIPPDFEFPGGYYQRCWCQQVTDDRLVDVMDGIVPSSYTHFSVQNSLGLIKAPYAAKYITEYMGPSATMKFNYYHNLQNLIYGDAMDNGDVRDMIRPDLKVISGRYPSWCEWLTVLLEATRRAWEIEPRPRTQTKSGLLGLPIELLTMIYCYVLKDERNWNNLDRPRVALENRWCHEKIQYSYLTQVSQQFRASVSTILLGQIEFVFDTQGLAWESAKKAARYLTSFSPDSISQIQYLSLRIESAEKGDAGYKKHFAENPGLLEILDIFATHGHLRRLKLYFITTRKLTRRNRKFVKLLKAIKVDEVEFLAYMRMLGGRRIAENGAPNVSITLRNQIEKAMIRKREKKSSEAGKKSAEAGKKSAEAGKETSEASKETEKGPLQEKTS